MAEIIKSNAELEESLKAPAADIVGDGIVLGDPEDPTTEPTGEEPAGGEEGGEPAVPGEGGEGEGEAEEAEIEWSGENAARARHGWGDTKGRWYDPYTPEDAETEETTTAEDSSEGGDPASTDGEEEGSEESSVKEHWYDALVAPRPPVYHRKAKRSLFEHLYPDLLEEEGEGGNEEDGNGDEPAPIDDPEQPIEPIDDTP